MKTNKRSIALLLVLLTGVISACSSDNGSTSSALDGNSYISIDSENLVISETEVSGTGSIVFNDPLSGIASKHSFEFLFRLEDGGQLTLVSHSTNQLANGLEVRMSRDGNNLTVVLAAEGATNDVSGAFAGVDASGDIRLQIDVHNDEEPAHILIWDGEDFEEDAAILNSEESGFDTPGNGSGGFWGLILSEATVDTASTGEAKFVEDE